MAADAGGGKAANPFFREEALKRIASADELDRYVKVTNSASWTVLLAIAVLLVAAVVWGATATIPITVTTTGVVQGKHVVCFLPADGPASQANAGTKVEVAGRESSVLDVSDDPYSAREVAEELGSDYVVSSVGTTDWSYRVEITLPQGVNAKEGDDTPVQLVVKELAPLAYLLGGSQG